MQILPYSIYMAISNVLWCHNFCSSEKDLSVASRILTLGIPNVWGHRSSFLSYLTSNTMLSLSHKEWPQFGCPFSGTSNINAEQLGCGIISRCVYNDVILETCRMPALPLTGWAWGWPQYPFLLLGKWFTKFQVQNGRSRLWTLLFGWPAVTICYTEHKGSLQMTLVPCDDVPGELTSRENCL